jgi:hypothetical protein
MGGFNPVITSKPEGAFSHDVIEKGQGDVVGRCKLPLAQDQEEARPSIPARVFF